MKYAKQASAQLQRFNIYWEMIKLLYSIPCQRFFAGDPDHFKSDVFDKVQSFS